MKPRLRLRLAAALLLGMAAACSRTSDPLPPVEGTWTAMGTFASVAVPAAEAQRLEVALAAARAILAEVEHELSPFHPESLVSQINASSGQTGYVALTPHARTVFPLAHQAHERSGGAFDATVGPWMNLWGFRTADTPIVPPDPEALATVAERVGWRHVDWQGDRARLAVHGMRLDFGAVAKGYGVDAVFERLLAKGFTNVMVNLGGDLRCAGSARPGHRPGWWVSVRDPFLPHGEGSLGTLKLSGGRAVTTSGRYERFIEIDGKRYAHIIDPRTGQPVGGVTQVTVIADTAADADALSTALFVLGPGPGRDMLRAYPGAEVLFVPDPAEDDGKPRALATAGFLEEFDPSPEWAPFLHPFGQ